MSFNREELERQYREAWDRSSQIGETIYAKWVEKAKKDYHESFGSNMGQLQVHNLVIALRNTEKDLSSVFGKETVRKALFESTTTPTDINKFINQAFEMVTALLPVNIIEKFTSVQSMDKRVAEVFYMNIKKGSNKGKYNVSGNDYMGALTSPKDTDQLSSPYVEGELVGTGDGSTLTFTGVTLAWKPLLGATLKFTIGAVEKSIVGVVGTTTIVFTADTDLASGSIAMATGVTSNIVFQSGHAPDNGTLVEIDYEYNSLLENGQIPEVYANLETILLTAKRRALNMKYLFDAALLLDKEHGIDMEKELTEKAIAGMMNEIAVKCAADLYTAATGSGITVTFSATPPSNVIPQFVHLQSLLYELGKGAIDIQKEIRFANASFIIAGAKCLAICRGLPKDIYKAAQYEGNKKPIGMYVAGMLDDQYEIIQNLDYAIGTGVIGAHGDWLYSGSVYGEFIPVTVMNANWNSSADVWKSAIQWSAFKVLNSKFYGKIAIS